MTGGRHWRGEVALIALVDVVFLLILFLILAGHFEQIRVFALDAPGPATGSSDRGEAALLVSLAADGSVDLSGEPLSIVELISRLTTQTRAAVLLRVDPEVRLRKLVALVDSLREHGIDDVALFEE